MIALAPRRSAGPVVAPIQPLAVDRERGQPDHVVRGPAVAERPRPARVVADHPADRAAGVGRRVGPEPQPVRPGRGLQRGLHGARLHAGGAASPGRPTSTRSRCRLKSSTTPGPIALPATDVPAPRAVIGTPELRHTASVAATSSSERGRTIGLRHDPVERGVGRVHRAVGRIIQHVADPAPRSRRTSSLDSPMGPTFPPPRAMPTTSPDATQGVGQFPNRPAPRSNQGLIER